MAGMGGEAWSTGNRAATILASFGVYSRCSSGPPSYKEAVVDEMRWQFVRNHAPFQRAFLLKDGTRVVLDPGVNRLSREVVEKLEKDPRFTQLLSVGNKEGRSVGVSIVEGPDFLRLVSQVESGEVSLNSIKYVQERVKVIEKINDPIALRKLLEGSTSVTVNHAITARLKQLERY